MARERPRSVIRIAGADAGLRDRQSCWNALRAESVRHIHARLKTDPATAHTELSRLMGDFDACGQEDPIRAPRESRWFDALTEAASLGCTRRSTGGPVGLDASTTRYFSARLAARCVLRVDLMLRPGFPPPPELTADWSDWLRLELEVQNLQGLRESTHRGVPFGSGTLLCQLEKMNGTPLRPRKAGRQPGGTRRNKKTQRRN